MGKPQEFDCELYPQGRDFDQTSRPQGGEFWHGRHILDNGESKVNHLLMFCLKVQLRLWYVIYCFPLLCNKE